MEMDVLTDELEVLAEFMVLLLDDAERCAREGKLGAGELKELDQFWARALTRAFFSAVEGFSHGVKRVAVAAHEVGELTLAPEELALLTTPEVFLADNGRAKSRERTMRTRPSLRFALDLVSRIGGSTQGVDHGGRGWRSVDLGLRVRDRLTHPKAVEDFKVTQEEVERIAEAARWLGEEVNQVANELRSRTASRAHVPG